MLSCKSPVLAPAFCFYEMEKPVKEHDKGVVIHGLFFIRKDRNPVA